MLAYTQFSHQIPPAPSTLSAFPARPPSQTLLSPKRRAEILLNKVHSRATLNVNDVIQRENPMITQKCYQKRHRDFDQDLIDKIVKQRENDVSIAKTQQMSDFTYKMSVHTGNEETRKKIRSNSNIYGANISNNEVVDPDSCRKQIQQLAHSRCPSPVKQRGFTGHIAEKQRFSWIYQMNQVETDFYTYFKYNEQYQRIKSQGQKREVYVENLPRKVKESPFREAKSRKNKYGSYGTGNVCPGCGQIIREKCNELYPRSSKVCIYCGQYLKQ